MTEPWGRLIIVRCSISNLKLVLPSFEEGQSFVHRVRVRVRVRVSKSDFLCHNKPKIEKPQFVTKNL